MQSIAKYLLMAVGVFAIVQVGRTNEDWRQKVGFGVLMLILAIIALFRSLKRQAVLFESMVLTVDDSGITRTQQDTPTKTLAADEITRIERVATGAFVIKGKNPTDTIWMPAQVASPEQLTSELARFGSVVPTPAPAWYTAYLSMIGLLVLPLMYFFFSSANKLVTILCGTALLATLGASQWIIFRSKDIDNGTKRVAWILWLVMLWIVATFVIKLH